MFQRGHRLVLRHLAGQGAGAESAALADGGAPGRPPPQSRPRPRPGPPLRSGGDERANRHAGGGPRRYLQAALTALERFHRQLHGGRGGVHCGRRAPHRPPLRAAAPGARRNRPPPPEAARGACPGPAPHARPRPGPARPDPGPLLPPQESPWRPASRTPGARRIRPPREGGGASGARSASSGSRGLGGGRAAPGRLVGASQRAPRVSLSGVRVVAQARQLAGLLPPLF